MLNVKSNFTDQYLLILTLGLTNNIFLLNVRPCLVELNVQYIWIEEVCFVDTTIIWQHWFTPCCEFSHCLWFYISLSYHTQDMALNGGDGVTGEKIIDLQGYREGRGGVHLLLCVKGENQVFMHHHCYKVFYWVISTKKFWNIDSICIHYFACYVSR